MVSLRDELRMQMWSIHTRYDCARKVLSNHLDLQKLPERQAKGALQKIWSDWTFSNKHTRKDAYKTISKENARRMTNMLMQDRREAYQSGRLSVYMEDVVRRLERLQRGESEEEEKSQWLTRRKQEIWDEQVQVQRCRGNRGSAGIAPEDPLFYRFKLCGRKAAP